MDIQLKSLSGKNLATGREQTSDKYLVICDNSLVGVIHYRHSNTVAFTKRLDPLKKQQVIERVAEMLDVTSLDSREVPSVPEEILNREEPGEEFYEFDQEGTT